MKEDTIRKLFSENLPTEKLYARLRKGGRIWDLDTFVGGKPKLYELLREYQGRFNAAKRELKEYRDKKDKKGEKQADSKLEDLVAQIVGILE